jgi:hypothetical protein
MPDNGFVSYESWFCGESPTLAVRQIALLSSFKQMQSSTRIPTWRMCGDFNTVIGAASQIRQFVASRLMPIEQVEDGRKAGGVVIKSSFRSRPSEKVDPDPDNSKICVTIMANA